ncbi:MAG TPA: tetratricopeptide repeat protein [Candidatus Acidoferrum sp.]|nr:tetratricopeptide repeat protein [Candidatus Acidoferrum sp.]
MGRKKRNRATEAPAPLIKRGAAGDLGRWLGGRPTLAGVIWLVVIVMVVGVSGGYLVYRAAGPAATTTAGPAAGDPAASFRVRIQQNPKDIEALLGLAHLELDQQQLDAAESLYRQVLSEDPKNAEAITHLGTVLLGRGQVDAALQHYDQALAIQPGYVHALWDKANLLQHDKQDYAGAIRTWEAFIQAVGPDSQDGKTAQKFIAEAKQAMGSAPPAGKTPGGKS